MAYSEEQKESIFEEIFERIANGESLMAICKDEHMPDESRIRVWLRDDKEKKADYAHARQLQADHYFDKIREIAENQELGEVRKDTESIDGPKTEITTADMIQHRRLKIDTYKWILGRMSPNKYGDQVNISHSGNIDSTVKIVTKDEIDNDDIGFVDS